MSPLRVLLIGSEAPDASQICSMLEQASHAVLPVPNFAEASEALLIQKFDAVLIIPGLQAEGMGDFTSNLRQVEKNYRDGVKTPVVSFLRSGSQNSMELNGSIDAYLSEQFEPAAFATAVENLANAIARSTERAESSSAVELPVFNLRAFEAQVAHDYELMVEIIDLFLAERTQDLAEMAESLASGDLQKLMRSAHTIKGSLGSLHASLARSRAQELEAAARSGNRQACTSLLNSLEADLKELEGQLLSLRASVRVD